MEAPGTVVSSKNLISLTIYKKLFRSTFQNSVSNVTRCYDRLECILQTFEHELIHVLVNMYDEDLSKSQRENLRRDPHLQPFGLLLNNVFCTSTIVSFLGEDVDVYEGRTEYITKNLRLGDMVNVFGLSEPVEIIGLPYKSKDKLVVKVADEEGYDIIDVETINLKNKERKTSERKVTLSPVSRKSNRKN